MIQYINTYRQTPYVTPKITGRRVMSFRLRLAAQNTAAAVNAIRKCSASPNCRRSHSAIERSRTPHSNPA
jgi:hypothetical protein